MNYFHSRIEAQKKKKKRTRKRERIFLLKKIPTQRMNFLKSTRTKIKINNHIIILNIALYYIILYAQDLYAGNRIVFHRVVNNLSKQLKSLGEV